MLLFLRRAHMYSGLGFLPWVVLYGVTAILFNHPSLFSDQPTVMFDRSAWAGTSLDPFPTPRGMAEEFVAELRRQGTTCQLVDPEGVRFSREYAFATIRAGETEVSLLVAVNGSGGTIRSRVVPPPPVPVPSPPFARIPEKPRSEGPARPFTPLKLKESLPERLKAEVPGLLRAQGFPTGDVTVTSVPDLLVTIEADGAVWEVSYNALTGIITGRPQGSEPPKAESSTRRLVTRLHTLHGYPPEGFGRTAWAVIVDLVGVLLLFWAGSGLVMAWQVRSARRGSVIVLMLSTLTAGLIIASVIPTLN